MNKIKDQGFYNQILNILTVAFTYFLFGKLAFFMSVSNEIVTNVPFFSEGISLASTILFGNLMAIGVFAGQFSLALSSSLPLETAIAIGLTNATLAIFGRFLFRKLRISPRFRTPKDVLLLAGLIALVLQPTSAILSNLALLSSGTIQSIVFLQSIFAWWAGNVIGQLSIVPILLLWFKKKQYFKTNMTKELLTALLVFIAVFLLFKFTQVLDSRYTFIVLMFLFPITFLFAAQVRTETFALSALSMTIAAFVAVAFSQVNFLYSNRIETFMQLDLIIIGLHISGLILVVLINHLKSIQTQLISSKTKLIANQAQLDAIVSTSLAGFTIIDRDGVQLFTNRNAELIHGYSKHAVIGSEFRQLLHPDDVQQTDAMLADVLNETVQFVNTELRLIHKKSQQVVWIHATITKYPKLAAHDKESVLIAFQDISQQKQNTLQLAELNTTKDKFISILAHDLRTPFNALLFFSDLLKNQRESCDQETFDSSINIMYETSKNTYALLENLLQWARTQQKRVPFHPEAVKLGFLVRECIALVNSTAQLKQLTIIDRTQADKTVWVDVEMIKTVLRNLLTNAIKFSRPNGMITLNTTICGDQVEVTVADNGVGMSAATQQGLFYLDSHVSTRGTAGESGTGLGLLICKEFVTLNGGNIWVTSELNRGSEFKFTLSCQAPASL
ncbi:ATP-binding protein [Thiospirillum jenense]|uniref:histidine kinase n=1 Tax=Thiospirillum jenense TaxID=1653858 RepID=A0A839HDW8_9GAMM|nr:ATP-binding protein [Thiospirillum jenense]MBB1127125.1 PAS domain S-box protein [Thiospirillum jenense]